MKVPPGPLRSRNFRLLLACSVISVTGTAVAIVATPFAVLAIGGSAQARAVLSWHRVDDHRIVTGRSPGAVLALWLAAHTRAWPLHAGLAAVPLAGGLPQPGQARLDADIKRG